MLNKDSKKIILVYILWLIPVVFSSIWLLYFKSAGLSDFDIALAYLMWPIAAVLTILLFAFLPPIDKRMLMSAGAVAALLSYLIILFFQPSFLLLAVSFFVYGFSVFLFWVPFNILYFRKSNEAAATDSTIYFSIGGLLSILLSALGGIVSEYFGWMFFFLASSILFIPVAVFVFSLKKEEYKYDSATCINGAAGFRTLNFLEGTLSGVFVAGTLISLSLLDRPVFFGIFIAFITIASIAASLIVSRISDKTKKRFFYMVVFGVLTALSTVSLAFFYDVASWAILSSLRNFLSSLFWPFTTALIIDSMRDMNKVMVSRELFLNIGRIFGIAIVVFSIYFFSDVRLSIVFLGLLFLLYPVFLKTKKHKIVLR